MDIVSIIAIGFNVQETIKECINSIQAQTYENLEIIFVDDGSSDKTAEIVKELEKKDNRIKYIFQENSGANAARKKGFKYVMGDYCMFIDGDDLLESKAIEICMKKINEKNYDFVCYDFYRFTEDKEKVKDSHQYSVEEYVENEYLTAIMDMRTPHYLWNKLYRVTFLNKLPFDDIPNITMGDDMAANVRMGIVQPKTVAIPEKLYGYRVSSTSVSGIPNKKYYDLIAMMDDIQSKLNENNLLEEYRELLEFNYFLNFYYYVVRNKYPYVGYQKAIYKMWKEQNVKISENKKIFNFVKKKNIVLKALIYMIDKYEIVEIVLTKIYCGFRK